MEPNSISYQNLETKNRKAFAINACISTSSHPDVVDFKVHGMGSTVIKGEHIPLKHLNWDQ